MKLYEYQGKELLAAAGIPVPEGRVVRSADEAAEAADAIGLPCVLKAQMLAGKRGKAGLIRIVETADDARQGTADILAARKDIDAVLVEQKLDITREIYLSAMPDPVTGGMTLIASTQGGVDIEETADSAPESIVRENTNVLFGLLPFNLRNLIAPLALDKAHGKALGNIVRALMALCRQKDALLAEINPLAITADDGLIAADAKITIDDHALWRQPFEQSVDAFENDVEFEAAKEGIPYLQFNGNIGLMCAGAGLTNTVLDLIHDFGGRPANFLEFGGPNYRRAKEAMRLALRSGAKVLLIVTFGTIARADVMAEGIAEAIEELKPDIPIVTAIRGTNEESASETLRSIGLEPLMDTEEAVRRAIALAAEGGEG